MKYSLNNILLLLFVFFTATTSVYSSNSFVAPAETEIEVEDKLDVKVLILDHLADSYEWHIWGDEDKHISIYLPVILYSKTSGWHFFLSSAFNNEQGSYEGFYIASEGKYRDKIVEIDSSGNEVRPIDLSMTKNAASLIINSLILILIVLYVGKVVKRDPLKPHKGFVGLMEVFILTIEDEVIKATVGKEYKRFSPYLLTVFFFIFFNNIMGLVPIFPGGANVTGNIAVTLVLAVGTFLVINLTGSRAYYKEIFWPDVPVWLKVPFPLMPIIEIVGLFTKPFALMIRLFANIMAGHAILLGLTCLIFITVSLGPVMNSSMTVISVIFTVFINFLEILVAFIQAYVFTLLSSVFIGLARDNHSHEKDKQVVSVDNRLQK